jgi:sec-independent protein translocase protein TatC
MALVPFPGPQSGALKLPHDDDEDDDFSSGKMSFLEHLDELRRRIIYSISGVFVGVLVSFVFINRIVDFVLAPTIASLPEGSRMIYTQPQEAFSRYIAVALISGIVLAAPFIMWQVWRFIAPGLYTNEKKLAIPFVVLSTSGFIGGAAFSHYIAYPLMNRFFASFNSPDLLYMPRLSDVFGLYTKMVLATGVIFQMPTVVLFLAKMDMITARFLIRKFKIAVLIIFIVAAVITPDGNPMGQAIMAAPMVGLYGLSIGIAWIVGSRRRTDAQDDTD